MYKNLILMLSIIMMVGCAAKENPFDSIISTTMPKIISQPYTNLENGYKRVLNTIGHNPAEIVTWVFDNTDSRNYKWKLYRGTTISQNPWRVYCMINPAIL